MALDIDVAETAEAELTILSYPNLPKLYRRKVEQLEAVLEGTDCAQAIDLIRSMIARIDLRPREGAKGLDAILHGDLAAILAACAGAAQKENFCALFRQFWLYRYETSTHIEDQSAT